MIENYPSPDISHMNGYVHGPEYGHEYGGDIHFNGYNNYGHNYNFNYGNNYNINGFNSSCSQTTTPQGSQGLNGIQSDGMEPTVPLPICPDIYYSTLNNFNNQNLQNHNFKIIISCLPTHKFLNHINKNPHDLSISSDVIMLSLDLNFDINQYNETEKQLLEEFMSSYGKVLQNFINYFVTYNDNYNRLINDLPNNLSLRLMNPLLLGNLKNNLFKLIRLVKLIKLINDSVEVLVIGDFNENISKSLLIGYLMDTYNFPINSSMDYLGMKMPLNFNMNYYNDLLILENLKKFHQENNDLKVDSKVLYENKEGKRGRDEDGEGVKRVKR